MLAVYPVFFASQMRDGDRRLIPHSVVYLLLGQAVGGLIKFQAALEPRHIIGELLDLTVFVRILKTANCIE